MIVTRRENIIELERSEDIFYVAFDGAEDYRMQKRKAASEILESSGPMQILRLSLYGQIDIDMG